jgi:hypothetical protein
MNLVNQNGRLTFTGTAGQQVSLWVTSSTLSNAFITLIAPDQSVQNIGGFTTSGGFFGPITLGSAGTYTFVIDPSGTATGCATFQLFTGTDVFGAIAPGGAPVQTCNTVPGQNMQLVFSGTSGQRISIQVTGSTLSNAFITLVRPDQSVQNVGGFGTSSLFFDTVTLPSTGTYILVVDPSSTATGCATIQIFDVPRDTSATVTPGGAAVPICNTVPGQDMNLTFSGTSGQRISLLVTNSTLSNAFITLVAPNQSVQNIGGFGPIAPIAAGTFFDTVTLAGTGTYTLHINPSGTATGCATIQVLNVPPDTSANVTPGGSPVAICNTVAGQDMNLTFSGTAGQRISLQVTNSTLANAFISLVAPNQSVQNIGSFGLIAPNVAGTFFDTVTLGSAGTYTLHIDPSGTSTGCATVQVFDVPPDASTSLTVGGSAVQVCNTVPGQDINLTFNGTSGQQVSLHVTGSAISNAFVTLVRPDQTTQNIGSFGTNGATFAAVTLQSTGAFAFHVNISGNSTGCATFSLV